MSFFQDRLITNDIINGAMDIWQRGTSFASPSSLNYLADRFKFLKTSTGGDVTITQNTDTPNERFNYSMKIDVTTADAIIDANDLVALEHIIEGNNYKKYVGNYGLFGFYVKTNKTGTYCISFINSGVDRSFVREYTISVANMWTFIEIPPILFSDQGGSWGYTNGIGLRIRIALMAGSNFQTTPDLWQTGNFIATSNQVNFMDDTANEFFITGITFNLGTKPIGFSYYDIQKEISRCQRYYDEREVPVLLLTNSAIVTYGGVIVDIPYTCEMRTIPTVTFYPSSVKTNPGNLLKNGAINTTGFLFSKDIKRIALYNNGGLTLNGEYMFGYVTVDAEL